MKRKLLALLLLLALLSGCAGRAKPDKQTPQATSTATQTAVTESVPTTTEVTPTTTEPTEVATTEPVTTVRETTPVKVYAPHPLVPLVEPSTGMDEPVRFRVSTTSPFSVKNAEGKWLKEPGELGTLEIYQSSFLVTEPITLTYQIASSLSYLISFDKPCESSSINLAWNGSDFVNLGGSSISEVFISYRYTCVVGKDVSYYCYRAVGDGKHSILFTGQDESNFTFYADEDGYTLISSSEVKVFVLDDYADRDEDEILWSAVYPAGTNHMPFAEELIAAAMEERGAAG